MNTLFQYTKNDTGDMSAPSPLPAASSDVEEGVLALILEVDSTRNNDKRQNLQFATSNNILNTA